MKFDFLIVGSGLFGCTFANLVTRLGKKCLILEKRNHLFGNCHTNLWNNIHIHQYGPHIFHTNSLKIWNYINSFGEFNNFINRPKVLFDNKLFSFPINLMTMYQLWGVTNPSDAISILEKSKVKYNKEPDNLEEWALSQIGPELYKIFIYGYTKKQWNTHPINLPSSIIKRIPIRLDFNDNYYFDIYQGIPINGYSSLMQNMIDGIETVINTDYLSQRDYWDNVAKTVVYTGPIDDFFDNQFGALSYRSLKFSHDIYHVNDYQGNAIINYTDEAVSYTRKIEHKHFVFGDNTSSTMITTEYPANYLDTQEKYYPINNDINNKIYQSYKSLTKHISEKYIFGGRLAEYRYYDMHQVIGSAMSTVERMYE